MISTESKYKQTVQGAFDEAAAGYDNPAMRFFDNSAQNLIRQLALKGDERILDAATGTGKIAVSAARELKTGHVTGIDMSAGMLAVAQKKAVSAGLSNVSFLQADVDSAHFPSAGFDGLTCGFGVHFWSNMETSLGRLIGMVKRGGFVAITSFAKGSFEPHASLCLKRFSDYGVKMPKSYTWERLDHADKNVKLFNAVGLKEIQVRTDQVGYPLESASHWWDLVLFTGFRAFLNQLTPDQALRFKKEFLDEVAATANGRSVFLNVPVITAIGRVPLSS